jgi:hypothetical protein
MKSNLEKELLKNYYKAVNSMVEELLKKKGYDGTTWRTYEGKYITICDTSEGTEFLAGDGSDDGGVMSGYWIGSDIGGLLCVNEEWYLSANIIKEALEIGASLDDVFEYLDYEFDCSEKKVDKKFNFKSYFKLGEEGRKEILKGSDSTKLKKTMKKCIFKRIKQCAEEIEEKITLDKIYGFELLDYISNKVDQDFKQYKYERRYIIINRIYDNLHRGELGHFHF